MTQDNTVDWIIIYAIGFMPPNCWTPRIFYKRREASWVNNDTDYIIIYIHWYIRILHIYIYNYICDIYIYTYIVIIVYIIVYIYTYVDTHVSHAQSIYSEGKFLLWPLSDPSNDSNIGCGYPKKRAIFNMFRQVPSWVQKKHQKITKHVLACGGFHTWRYPKMDGL